MSPHDEINKLKDYDNFIANIHKKRITKYKNYKRFLNKIREKNIKHSHKEVIDKKNNVIQIILDDLKKKESKDIVYNSKNSKKDIDILVEYLRITN